MSRVTDARVHKIAIAFCVSAILTGPVAAMPAQQMTHDEVLIAVAAGRLAPLEDILGAVRSTSVVPQQITLTDEPIRSERQLIDVRALSRDGAYLYEVWILEVDGAVVQLFYHGKSAELMAWAGPGSVDAFDEVPTLDRLFARLATEAGAEGGGQ